MVGAMTVITASSALASDLMQDPAKHETDKDKGTVKEKKGKLKDLFK